MGKENNTNTKYVIIGVLIFLFAPVIIRHIGFGIDNTDRVRAKIEKYLYEKYGEEFVVDRIGLRSSRGEYFYQARIYPKSIIGTNKEWDDYYYATASVNKYSFGRLGGVGDSYGLTKINIGAEEYLLSKAKEVFGHRIKIKPEIKYKIENDLGFYEWNKEPDFLKALAELNKFPEQRRIELDLDIYIFDRIDDEREKEMRRKQIFDFIQYLKEEGLFEYLEMGVIFIDERVLAPGYNKFRREIDRTTKVKEKVDGETVYMPPMELRERMSRELQAEIDMMSEEELLESMRKIRKSDLSYKVLEKYNATHYGLIYSVGILQEKYKTAYERHIENNKINNYYYNDISNVKIGRNLEYAYIK